jgi:hypothetical protein
VYKVYKVSKAFRVYRAYKVYKVSKASRVFKAYRVFKDLVLYGEANGIMLHRMPSMIQFIMTETAGFLYIMTQ